MLNRPQVQERRFPIGVELGARGASFRVWAPRRQQVSVVFDWPGVSGPRQVLYELHVGTFTQAGTWEAAAEHLPHLAELGVTMIEVMPIADFAGRFGWGYDGVDLFAPSHLYGTPDDVRRFVD